MAAKKKGGGGFLGTIVWAFFILCVVFAWFKTPVPAETAGVMGFAQAKAASVEAWVNDVTEGGTIHLDRIFRGAEGLEVEIGGEQKVLGDDKAKEKPSGRNVESARKDLDGIASGGQKVSYNRDDWDHWQSTGNCGKWDVRDEVLADEAVRGSLTLLDKDGNEVATTRKACSIESGKWIDPYTGKTFTDPSKMDIDHMIPLSYAAQHGGQEWDSKKKAKYANDQRNDYSLIAVDAGANRSKGDKGPSKWLPTNEAYHCEYGIAWTSVAKDWALSLADADKKTIANLLKTC